ncbi:MAG: hypothetical protein V4490_00630, partial [Pseudomonadota bacterium]
SRCWRRYARYTSAFLFLVTAQWVAQTHQVDRNQQAALAQQRAVWWLKQHLVLPISRLGQCYCQSWHSAFPWHVAVDIPWDLPRSGIFHAVQDSELALWWADSLFVPILPVTRGSVRLVFAEEDKHSLELDPNGGGIFLVSDCLRGELVRGQRVGNVLHLTQPLIHSYDTLAHVTVFHEARYEARYTKKGTELWLHKEPSVSRLLWVFQGHLEFSETAEVIRATVSDTLPLWTLQWAK